MNDYRPENPLIIQADYSVLVEVASPRYEAARDALIGFAELLKSPEHVHTYRISPLSIWNARASGLEASEMVTRLHEFARYGVPPNVDTGIRELAERYGRVVLRKEDSGDVILETDEEALAIELSGHESIENLLLGRRGPKRLLVDPTQRGRIKQALIRAGFPAEDLAGYSPGESLDFALREVTLAGRPFALRDYQIAAVDAFHAGGTVRGGSGVVVLPCGAGKTVVALSAMAHLSTSTLILATSVTAARQWIAEILDKTTLTSDQVGEYNGSVKEVRPVTVATYQIITHRAARGGSFTHLDLFDRRDWGLIIYDEVHLLPAPVFQMTAALQARRRLGLTATLVREDGREEDVFALVGPKRADAPWKELERQGWIATASCTEVRVDLPANLRMPYATAGSRAKFRIASENPAKTEVARRILDHHADLPALVIGMYVDQVAGIGAALGLPVLSGETPQSERDQLFEAFRNGELRALAVTKVANFAVDLPDAALAIQISGTFGSRQEEAQRLGRILRPKKDGGEAHFYSLVSRDTVEQDFAHRRQLFLCEQGYEYSVAAAQELFGEMANTSS